MAKKKRKMNSNSIKATKPKVGAKAKANSIVKRPSIPKKLSKAKKPSKAKQPSKTDSVFELRLNSQVWPVERDVLFRPDRMKYVRKIIKPTGCVFCESWKSGPSFESLCLYKGEHSMVVLNKFPYNSGHLLIVPRRHVGALELMTDAEYVETQVLLRHAVKALEAVYAPGGVNVGLNLGAAAGAGIPEHVHTHIVPRWAGDLNFYPLIANTKVVVESLEQTYSRLSEYFMQNPALTLRDLNLKD